MSDDNGAVGGEAAYLTAIWLDSYRGDASEDRAAIVATSDGSPVLVVADGIGGRPGGGRAATRFLEVISTFAADASTATDYWSRALAHTDSVISNDPEVGETTGIVAQVTGDRRIVGAYVGDSEAWCISAADRRRLTDRVDKPWIGSGGARPFPFSARIPAAGATLLLATDGLFRYSHTEAIVEAAALGDIEEAIAALAILPRRADGRLPDDLAIALCRIPAVPSSDRRIWRLPLRRG